ncbi:MAG TPA: ATP-grasp domain-containing protein [Candidatus Omnitrophota bacterium]|nr:ATP-grasp domain-containing protein [Candidatus Omnitrophota bacterium]
MGKKIGITYDLKSDWGLASNDPLDINAEFDKPETVQRVITAMESGGHKVTRIGNVHSLLKQIDRLDVDIVFNMCEGQRGRNREAQVPVILEMKNIPFIGADGLTLAVTLDKVVAKKLFISEGIPTPKFFIVDPGQAIPKDRTIKFPLMVKTRHEGSSKGISEKSRVEDIKGLKRQIDMIHETYRQSALVEEFIKGMECTVAVLGNEPPMAMPIAQVSIDGNVQLGKEFYTHGRIASDSLQYVCPARMPKALTKKIQDIAVRVYKCVECRDFGRVDFRIDERGRPYVLEINPLPSLDLKDVFNIFPSVFGSNYDEIINKIVDFGLKRYNIIDKGSLGASFSLEKSLEGLNA